MNPSALQTANPKRVRQSLNVNASLEKRLLAYAASASAAGVSLLAAAPPADAKIVYTPAHKKLPLNGPFYLDLNHDHINDFRFQLVSNMKTSQSNFELLVYPLQNGNGIWWSNSQGVSSCAAALPKGTRIGPKKPFKERYLFMFIGQDAASSSFCAWRTTGNKEAYLGLKFSVKGEIHFGWARFVTHSRPHPTAELTGYAYETIPNKAIVAGATKGSDVATLRPAMVRGSLGSLATGAR
jgi:hypothetical protein